MAVSDRRTRSNEVVHELTCDEHEMTAPCPLLPSLARTRSRLLPEKPRNRVLDRSKPLSPAVAPASPSATTTGRISLSSLAVSKIVSKGLDLSDDDDDDSSSSSSSHESALGDLIGDKVSSPSLLVSSTQADVQDVIEDEVKEEAETEGKLKLTMPKPLDEVLKKVLAPMIKRVIASRDEVKEGDHDEWDWSRLDSTSNPISLCFRTRLCPHVPRGAALSAGSLTAALSSDE